jgi:hypothetical protein
MLVSKIEEGRKAYISIALNLFFFVTDNKIIVFNRINADMTHTKVDKILPINKESVVIK